MHVLLLPRIVLCIFKTNSKQGDHLNKCNTRDLFEPHTCNDFKNIFKIRWHVYTNVRACFKWMILLNLFRVMPLVKSQLTHGSHEGITAVPNKIYRIWLKHYIDLITWRYITAYIQIFQVALTTQNNSRYILFNKFNGTVMFKK